MTDLLYKELTFKMIGAAMEVHRVLGPGFLEAVYVELNAATKLNSSHEAQAMHDLTATGYVSPPAQFRC